MYEQILEVINSGFKPVVYIDSELFTSTSVSIELRNIINHSKLMKIPVFYTTELTGLNKLRKAHVFRYGYLPPYTEMVVKRKGGRIVSGNLKVQTDREGYPSLSVSIKSYTKIQPQEYLYHC